MSLDYVILGILERRPSTGYDLSKIMDRTTNFYWQATHAQIHQRLKRLQKDGMVKEEPVWEKGRPARIIYHLTSKGRRALVDWEKTPPEDLAVRHGFLSQFNSSYVLEGPEIVEKIDIHQGRSQERLELHQQAVEIIKKKDLKERKNQIDYLMALYGVMFEQTCQDWCMDAKKFLEEQDNTSLNK
ncbi:MAG: helix-turn-helix transcriptional regulator [Methanomassiliicoccales archaeon]